MSEGSAGPGAAARVRREPPRWLVPGVLLLFLAGLTAAVRPGGPLVSLDHRIRGVVLAHADTPRWHWLVERRLSPARLLVNLGDTRIAVPVLLTVAITLAIRRRTVRPLAAAAGAVVLLLVTVIPAKIIIARPSPGLGAVGPGGWGAFPSGHTTTGSTCYVLAALLIAGSVVTRRRRVALAGSMLPSSLIGIALVWRDFHWFTDVLAGWALAAFIVQAALWLAGWKWPGRKRLTDRKRSALPGRTESERVPDAQESVAPS